MAVTISRDNVFFAFSPQLKAIARIEQGQEVLLQTHDCFEMYSGPVAGLTCAQSSVSTRSLVARICPSKQSCV